MCLDRDRDISIEMRKGRKNFKNKENAATNIVEAIEYISNKK